MAEAAVSRGYSYIAITDHSKGLKIAGGIDEEQLSKQAEEITAVNEGMRSNADRFGILRSVELNLSPSGAGDMEQSALDRLEFIEPWCRNFWWTAVQGSPVPFGTITKDHPAACIGEISKSGAIAYFGPAK
jgi:hypothetical protein